MNDNRISRSTFAKGLGLGAVVAAAGFPAFIPRIGEAADTIKIGQIEELTGVYAAPAGNEVRGAQLAVDAWNRRGGVLGRKVEVVLEDDGNNPGNAVLKARKLVNQDRVDALLGTLNSGSSLSVSGAANTMGVFFMDSGGHADEISGSKCHWNTFQVPHTTWMLAQATGYSIAKKFGKKWYMITPDYAFGHALAAAYEDLAKRIGCTIVANELTPLGTSDFSPYLTKVEGAKPDCLLVLVQGADWVNCMKQASSFGLFKKLPVAGPYVEMENVWALSPELRVGYWGCEWYYKHDLVLGKGNTTGRQFVDAYRKQFGTPPTERNCFAYVAMDRLLWAMSDAKSTDPVKVARALEDTKFHSLWQGTPYFRKADHSLMWPMWFGRLRPNGTPEDKYDVVEIIDRQEPEAIAKSAADQATLCRLDYPS
ncbi:ABC transporter substrate-binding protein [bacterium]|nr:MAG: ABC transporter substrate-binding protein [bacterium]